MRYVKMNGTGDASVMEIASDEMPEPGDEEIRIKIAYAGINRPDILQRQGLYPAPPGASPILGLECAGVVDAVGEKAPYQVGEPVCALLPGGGYAEYALAHVGHVLPVPEALTMAQAAALPEAAFTVWTNVFDRGKLAKGERLLVHGGASGIGTTAIQMARAMGAQVFATVGGAVKKAAIQKLDATVFDYNSENFEAELKAAKIQIDVILDIVGGDYIQGNINSLATEGRLINIAFLAGSKVEIDMLRVMLKRLHLSGSTLRTRSDADKAAIADALADNIWPLIEAGQITPIVDRIFDLDDVVAAHEYLDSGEHIGKVVLAVDPSIGGAHDRTH